jgi:hypothetical protein
MKRQPSIFRVALLLVLAGTLAVFGCSKTTESEAGETTEFEETEDYVEYGSAPGDSVVITGEADYVGPSETITGENTLVVEGENIVNPGGDACADPDATMDVVVVNGEVVDIICYPPPTEENMTTVVAQAGDTKVPQNANNTVVVFDPSTDGQVIAGDISVDGNNVAIYGNGADRTVIDGDIVITGNNARVRGLRVKGDVTLDLNDTALLYCVVEGNVEIRKNNVTMVSTTVFGNVTVLGNNAILVQNRVQGEWKIVGQEHFCDGNLGFADGNGDLALSDDELGEELGCDAQSPAGDAAVPAGDAGP